MALQARLKVRAELQTLCYFASTDSQTCSTAHWSCVRSEGASGQRECPSIHRLWHAMSYPEVLEVIKQGQHDYTLICVMLLPTVQPTYAIIQGLWKS